MSSRTTLVFVELNRLPKYTLLNISRTKRLFPEIPIVLLTNVSNKKELIELQEKNICEIVKVELNPNRVMLMNSSKVQESKKDNFWISTLERVFVLLDYHQGIPDVGLLHLESDVILFPSFPWDSFAKLPELSWGRYSATHDVAAILYSPNGMQSDLLRKALLKELEEDPDITDMTALSRVVNKKGIVHRMLPSAFSDSNFTLRSSFNCTAAQYAELTKNVQLFSGIFDLQSIGMWIDGIDPKHSLGISSTMPTSIFRKGESLIDLQDTKFAVGDDGQLSVLASNLKINIHSLHVHSKRLRWFSQEWKAEISSAIKAINAGRKVYRFSFHVFIKVFVQNLKQGTLLRLIAIKILPHKVKRLISSIKRMKKNT
jgi:hypothetical protein